MSKTKVVERDWDALGLEIKTLFTPAAPISTKELFAGRRSQLQRLIDAVAELGRHAVLFGEQGVGKTSLANTFHTYVELFNEENLTVIKKQASPTDKFSSLWKKVFRDLSFEIKRKGDYGNDDIESGSLADLYPEISPDDILRELGRFSSEVPVVVIFDEFDKLTDVATKKAMSHTIKALSDTGIRTTIILVGVADDINTIIEEHRSITRNLAEIKMPRMSKDELNEILDSRYRKAGMKIAGDARWKIVTLSRGLPEYVHALGKAAALRAIGGHRLTITEHDVNPAITDLIVQSDQSTSSAYRTATGSNNKNALYRQVLLACALADADDEGKFAAKDVVKPLSGILGKKISFENFQSHLTAFASDERGRILDRLGKKNAFRYRFREPKMQPYVIMQGVASGAVRNEALAVLSAPEQPKFSTEF
jgi:Cdc6-like AAA superfamily ATPase